MNSGPAVAPKLSKVIVGAVNLILERLSVVPDGREVQELREKALACLRVAETWEDVPVTLEQSDGVMKTVLDVHTRARRMVSARPRE